MTGHISTGYYPLSSGSNGGVILYLLTYLHGLFFVIVFYTLCGALSLQYVKLDRSLNDAAVQDSTLESVISFCSKGLLSFLTVYNRIRD